MKWRSGERAPWFAAKRYGYGAGLPITWQGWAALGLYLAVMAAAPLLLLRSLPPWPVLR